MFGTSISAAAPTEKQPSAGVLTRANGVPLQGVRIHVSPENGCTAKGNYYTDVNGLFVVYSTKDRAICAVSVRLYTWWGGHRYKLIGYYLKRSVMVGYRVGVRLRFGYQLADPPS
ncbi:MAG TPA: hypothetical protein VMR98_06120 [Candidatus Polarisedimenticolaceae bacterium]|nr:hypothetical protein [Candidatus Polarisedimenticolaceae bacterium]